MHVIANSDKVCRFDFVAVRMRHVPLQTTCAPVALVTERAFVGRQKITLLEGMQLFSLLSVLFQKVLTELRRSFPKVRDAVTRLVLRLYINCFCSRRVNRSHITCWKFWIFA